MKRLLHCALLLMCAALALGEEEKPPLPFGPLRIVEVGLNGEYAAGQPTSVRLQVANPQAQPLTADLRLHAEYHPAARRLAYGAGDTFSKQIVLAGNEQRAVELPVMLPVGNADLWVEVSAVAPDGRVVAYDRITGDKLSTRASEGNVGLLCVTDQTCKEAQEQAQFSGTMEERVDKNKKLHFSILREPRTHWWPYGFLQALVVAVPMSGYTAEQRMAMEYFLRRGGRLVLLEKEAGDADFLSAYRQGPATEVRVSRGKLYRVASLQSQMLGAVFSGGALIDLINVSPWQAAWMPDRGNSVMAWFRRHAATQFTFPRLRWLLIWLTVYIVVVGLVNFAILRRLRRLEWGWVTILAGALVFAAGFYVSSSRQRPKQFTLDDLAIYWMDQHSANAYGDYGLRISAPQRARLTLSVDDAAWWSPAAGSRQTPRADIGAEMREQAIAPGVEIRLGPPQQLDLALLRWSFADHMFEGVRQFAGTLREIAPGRVRNETGVALRDALLVDYEAQKMWKLGALAPGAEVSLADLASMPLRELDRQGRPVQEVPLTEKPGPPSLAELARTASLGKGVRRVVFGLSAGPTLPAELAGVSYAKNDRALLVIFE